MSSGDCEVALAEQPLGRPLLSLFFSLPGGGAGGSAGSHWRGVINMPLLKCGSVIQPVACYVSLVSILSLSSSKSVNC